MGRSYRKRALGALRDADLMTPERAIAYARIFAVVPMLVCAAWFVTFHAGIDVFGNPMGSDYVGFWSAGQIGLSGHSGDVYDPTIHWALQKSTFGREIGWTAFFYPPMFLLICVPLAALPYGWSLAVWLAVTGSAYVLVACRLLGRGFGPVVAFTAVPVNFGHGQNGLLSAALLSGGALLLDRRPVLAGALFGLLAYKPQLDIVVPIGLVAGGQLRALISAGAAFLAFVLLSYADIGSEAWTGFFRASTLAQASLEQGFAGHEKMQSTLQRRASWGPP